MTATRTSSALRGVAQAVRYRVRLRTRLRRVRDAWRWAFPRRLPPWPGPAGERVGVAPGPGRGTAVRDGVVVIDPAGASPRGRQQIGRAHV